MQNKWYWIFRNIIFGPFLRVYNSPEIVGVDNGSQFSMERFKANQRKAFFGRCLVVVKMDSPASKLKLKARGIDLKADTITIESVK